MQKRDNATLFCLISVGYHWSYLLLKLLIGIIDFYQLSYTKVFGVHTN